MRALVRSSKSAFLSDKGNIMKTFTGFEYLLIDLANAFGLDKLTFERRLAWARSSLDVLEHCLKDAENPPLFYKAMTATRKAQQGIPTGHLVGFDAACSGMQIMSVLMGCEAGAAATGLIHQDVRSDAYSSVTQAINQLLSAEGLAGVQVSRKQAKSATMTSLYGSTRQPKLIFGEDTPELKAFFEAMKIVAPGAWELLHILLASWQDMALSHEWELPDGFQAKIKVMDTVESRVEVDELGHSTFTYQYRENTGLPAGHHKAKSNAANVVHSIDAYVLRSIHRRCNYDFNEIDDARMLVSTMLTTRALSNGQPVEASNKRIARYIRLWEETGMADVVIAPHLTPATVMMLPTKMLQQLEGIMFSMLEHKPFEVVTIHDEFKCHANNMNHLRQHYNNILAELANSTVLDSILSQIHGQKGTVTKRSADLASKIRNANYALC